MWIIITRENLSGNQEFFKELYQSDEGKKVLLYFLELNSLTLFDAK